jgi:hypothetical protein
MAKIFVWALLFCIGGCATVPLANNHYELTESDSSEIVTAILIGAMQGVSQRHCTSNHSYDPSFYQDYSGGYQQNYSSGNQVVNEWEGLEKRAVDICKDYEVVERKMTSNVLGKKRILIIRCPDK